MNINLNINFSDELFEKGFRGELPIVFLDIDGVLNSIAWYKSLKSKEWIEDKIEKRAIDILNEISHWNFVISSTWRKTYTLEEMNEIFKRNGFTGTLLDVTPVVEFPGSVRGNEIKVWLDKNVPYEDRHRYVIFDDDSDMLLCQSSNFIHVDGYYGLSPNHIYRAKRLMNGKKVLD